MNWLVIEERLGLMDGYYEFPDEALGVVEFYNEFMVGTKWRVKAIPDAEMKQVEASNAWVDDLLADARALPMPENRIKVHCGITFDYNFKED